MPIPALIGAAAALGSTILNKKFADEANDRAVEQSEKMINQANARQDYLSANAALIHRNALSKAGYNLNADIGFQTPQALQGSAPAMTAGHGQIDVSSVLGALMQDRQLKQQQPLIDAQARQTAALAKEQEIKNNILEGKTKAAGSAEDIGALQWQDDILNINSKQLEYDMKYNQFTVQQLHNQLDALVTSKQLENPDVIDALENMPYRTSVKLVTEVNKLVQDIAESKQNVKESKQRVNESKQNVLESKARIGKIDAETSVARNESHLQTQEYFFKKWKYDMLQNSNVRDYLNKTFNKDESKINEFLNVIATMAVMHYSADAAK